MRLENNSTKQVIREAIIEQVDQELQENPRDNYIVSLPAENWSFESQLLPLLWKQKDQKHVLHCFESDKDRYKKSWIDKEGNLPFTQHQLKPYLNPDFVKEECPRYITGRSKNVEIIYERRNLDVYHLARLQEDAEEEKKRLIGWFDYCSYAIDYPDKNQTPIEDLMYAFNNYEDALIYVTHLFRFRKTRNEPKIDYLFGNFGQEGIVYNVNRFLKYCNGKYKSRNSIERCQIFKNLYIGGDNSPMLTAGWRTGSTEADHITQHEESYI